VEGGCCLLLGRTSPDPREEMPPVSGQAPGAISRRKKTLWMCLAHFWLKMRAPPRRQGERNSKGKPPLSRLWTCHGVGLEPPRRPSGARSAMALSDGWGEGGPVGSNGVAMCSNGFGGNLSWHRVLPGAGGAGGRATRTRGRPRSSTWSRSTISWIAVFWPRPTGHRPGTYPYTPLGEGGGRGGRGVVCYLKTSGEIFLAALLPSGIVFQHFAGRGQRVCQRPPPSLCKCVWGGPGGR